MKRLSLKHLLVMLFVGLLTMSGAVLGALGENAGENGLEKGDPIRDRTGECCDDLLGVDMDSCCGTGEHRNRNGQDKGVTLFGEGCCGTGEHQNQNGRKGGQD